MASVVNPRAYYTLLPRDSYVSTEIYEEELEKVFSRQWTFAAHESQIPEPGDFIVEEIAGESVIIVRDEERELHAFLNVCRHRGYQFCEKASGSVRRFICPYHRWSYGRDGKLLNAPESADGECFDYAEFGLNRVHLERWHSLVFVALGETAPPSVGIALDLHAGDMLPARPEQLREAARELYDVKANWKTMLENFLECYHCKGSHPELCESMSLEGSYADTQQWEGEYGGGATPLRPGRKTMSRDGELVSLPLGEYAEYDEIPENAGGGFIVFPWLTRIICHVDHMVAHVIRPISVDQTVWDTRWYVRRDAVEGRDYDVDRLTAMWKTTNAQDIGLVEGAFRGVRSRRFVSGPLQPEREPAIRAALEKYRDLMSAP
jgi:phenylpropionate dioxygenase-like ring-hydroxylating dioxygenase large terminal subunit